MSTPKLQAERHIKIFGRIELAIICVNEIRSSIMYNRYDKNQGGLYDMTQGEYWDEVYQILKLKRNYNVT